MEVQCRLLDLRQVKGFSLIHGYLMGIFTERVGSGVFARAVGISGNKHYDKQEIAGVICKGLIRTKGWVVRYGRCHESMKYHCDPCN